MADPSLIDYFAALEDPRQSWKVLFPLPEILLCGTLAGAEDFVEIRRWGQMHQEFLRRLLGAGPQNMATVRHMAMNLQRGPKDKHSLKVRRKSAAWDTAYLEALLRQSA